MRRTETRDGATRYPSTIEWEGEYHGVPVRVVIYALERRVMQWFFEIDGQRTREVQVDAIENVTTSEQAALRMALCIVERICRMKLERSAIRIGRARQEPVDRLAQYKLAQARKVARAKARRDRVARWQPSLPGFG